MKRKYPIVKYLVLLFCVFTVSMGSTFAKYASSVSGKTNLPISPFICDYSIESVSSSALVNADYWSGDDTDNDGIPDENLIAMNTPQNVHFTMRNYIGDTVSALDLMGSFRISAPAMFLDNAAIQMVTKEQGEFGITPQYVLSDILTTEVGATAAILPEDKYGKYGNIAVNGIITTEITSNTINTDTNNDGKIDNNDNRTLTLVGKLDGQEVYSIKITEDNRAFTYYLGFSRGVPYFDSMGNKLGHNMRAPIYYIRNDVTAAPTETENNSYYTIDITVNNEMLFKASEKKEAELYFYIVPVEKYEAEIHLFEEVDPEDLFDISYGVLDVPLYIDSDGNGILESTEIVNVKDIPELAGYAVDVRQTAKEGTYDSTNKTYQYDISYPTVTLEAGKLPVTVNGTVGSFELGGVTYLFDTSVGNFNDPNKLYNGTTELDIDQVIEMNFSTKFEALFVQN